MLSVMQINETELVTYLQTSLHDELNIDSELPIIFCSDLTNVSHLESANS